MEPPPPIRRGLSRVGCGNRQRGVQELANRPSMIRQAKSLRRGAADRFVPAAQVVMRDVQRDRRRWLSSFFEKPFVRRVKRRDAMRSERLLRST